MSAWRAQESALLETIAFRLTGYRGVLVGRPLGVDRQKMCTGALRFWQAATSPGPMVDVCFDGSSLPFESGSVDALIVVHGMALSTDPKGFLCECERVLSARGQLACLTFNPFSLWSELQRVSWKSRYRALPSRSPPARQLTAWLQSRDFEVTDSWHYGPGFPLFGEPWASGEHAGWRRSWAWLAPGYAVIARRRASRRLFMNKHRARSRKHKRSLSPIPTAGYHCTHD